MIASLLHSEEILGRVDTLIGLSHWELQSLFVLFLMNLISISREGNGLLGRELTRQLTCQELSHAHLKLHVGEELLSVLSFLKVFSLG